jgi:hypothetical protein
MRTARTYAVDLRTSEEPNRQKPPPTGGGKGSIEAEHSQDP